jgi:hypothetical protein
MIRMIASPASHPPNKELRDLYLAFITHAPRASSRKALMDFSIPFTVVLFVLLVLFS